MAAQSWSGVMEAPDPTYAAEYLKYRELQASSSPPQHGSFLVILGSQILYHGTSRDAALKRHFNADVVPLLIEVGFNEDSSKPVVLDSFIACWI
jgi:hypothetical protein